MMLNIQEYRSLRNFEGTGKAMDPRSINSCVKDKGRSKDVCISYKLTYEP